MALFGSGMPLNQIIAEPFPALPGLAPAYADWDSSAAAFYLFIYGERAELAAATSGDWLVPPVIGLAGMAGFKASMLFGLRPTSAAGGVERSRFRGANSNCAV